LSHKIFEHVQNSRDITAIHCDSTRENCERTRTFRDILGLSGKFRRSLSRQSQPSEI